jgi:hypothetical protein
MIGVMEDEGGWRAAYMELSAYEIHSPVNTPFALTLHHAVHHANDKCQEFDRVHTQTMLTRGTYVSSAR